MWGNPHYCTTTSPVQFSAPHQSSALSRTRYLCLVSKTALMGLQQARLSQQAMPTNSANPPMAEETKRQKPEKRKPVRTANHQLEGVLCQTHQEKAAIQYISKETTPDHLAAIPHGPWHTTAQLSSSSSSFWPGISTSQDP